MRRVRKKRDVDYVNPERWMVSYADFITLLFAFFVIMYALAQSDKKKVAAAAESIRRAFGMNQVIGVINFNGSSGGPTVNPFEEVEPPGGRVIDMPAGKTNTSAAKDADMQEIKEMMEESVSMDAGVGDSSDKLQMQFDSRGLIVRVDVKDFFPEGSAEARPDLVPILDQIGKVLSKTKRLIRFEGHTDISEANVAGFPSDWELSSARAAWVVKYMVKRFNLDPSRLGVAGYGHYRPVSHGTQAWDHGKNRRVEIIILNNLYEVP